ncbi:MAG: arginase [Acidobacteria bacterium]|nr:arginase [Acidobacteriota bacterium]
MTESLSNEVVMKPRPRVGIVGVPLRYGADMVGVELGPAVMRMAGLEARIGELGYDVQDLGDIGAGRPERVAEANDRLKYLSEISNTCRQLSDKVKSSLDSGALPVILGGDHSIAIGSLAGVSSHCRDRNKSLGLIWFDAHADMNTPQSTPSGHIHGMPLAVSLGFGATELTEIGGFSPKLDPKLCAHVGARDLDPGERELVRKLGMRFFTMREIDERGMSACMDEAIAIASRGTAGYAVTFDVDALDPNDAPGSGTLVRGGMTYREAHLAMEKIAEAGGMISLEVVEINAALDVNNKTGELGVELILSGLGKTIL